MTVTHPSIDDLLGSSLASLDVPEQVRQVAVARYGEVAAALERRGVVYPQGSFRLGTSVRPIQVGGEYDVDLVCRRDITKAATTQQDLKADVGSALEAFVEAGPEGSPALREGKRCWTLDYPHEPFHLDALPAIPDEEARPDGILITDRDVRMWQHSNPVAYSDWFYGVMATEFAERRRALAEAMQVDDVPEWRVKTTLQRTVQALKRHRDIYFRDRADDAPASIIVTTLAARAYTGPGDLFDVLVSTTEGLPSFVDVRDGVYWIPNPVQPLENFADRWADRPERAEAFFEWIEVAQRDLAAIGDETSIDRVLMRIAGSLGEDATRGGASALGERYRDGRERGDLRMTPGTGILGASSSGIAVRRHTFHGDSA